MSWVGCEEVTVAVNRALGVPAVRTRMRTAYDAGESSARILEELTEGADEEVALMIRRELLELPGITLQAILTAWAGADLAGMPFELLSVKPAEPLDAARRRNVRVTIDVDERGVTAALSHIATRHPEWAAAAS